MNTKQNKKAIVIKVSNKVTITLLVVLVIISVYSFLALFTFKPTRQPVLGVTFSKKFSEYLGLDWQANYLALLDDLQVKYLRLPAYWDEVEKTQGEYDFSDLDWMIEEAQKRDVKVTLVLGMRQPRWPECHLPVWASDLNSEVRAIKVLQLVLATVNHYKGSSAIEAWQVENEPLLEFFGECPRPDRELIKQEIRLVKSLDTRPIVITASGELSMWYPEALWGDILGSTLYRITWNEYTGYTSYWFLPPSFYRLKAFLLGQNLDNYWVVELQAEPWFPGDPLQASLQDMYQSMSPEQLIKNVEYAYKVNPARIYLWGGEWWYYTREKMRVNSIWETVERLRW